MALASQQNVVDAHVLVVGFGDESDSNPTARALEAVSDDGTVTAAASVADALELLGAGRVDCALVAANGASANDRTPLQTIREYDPTLPVVFYPARDGERSEDSGGDERTDETDTSERADEADSSKRTDEADAGERADDGSLTPEPDAAEAAAPIGTEFVPREAGTEALQSALERAVQWGRAQRRRAERARQFDAIFDAPDHSSWVLDPDGIVRRSNGTTLEGVGPSTTSGPADADGQTAPGEDDLLDRPLWELPPWNHVENGRETITSAVERAARGEVVHREVTVTAGDGRGSPPSRDGQLPSPAADGHVSHSGRREHGRMSLELTIRPVRDESGAVVSLVAQATDVTERARLERELRESEELHRVTLNHMTDTVLITNDDGEFTYVCPNVHFIFGYTAEEIYELGTIDALLGPDLFDWEALEAEEVLTNIECVATDRAGEEHTLLVNAREVSIQDGTVLYSCRDVTTRKRREEALTALHKTTRRLLYAESGREIATVVVEDAADVLDLEASATFLFDTDENLLRPAASTPAMERLHGRLTAYRANEESIVGEAFVRRTSRFFADVHDSSRLSNPETDVGSAAFVPLGDHGVFVAGSGDTDRFDEVTRELADLLAATAEAALDRVERETSLREQDRELKRQNRQLTRLDRINEIIREIDQALVAAETREEIETAVCDSLTADDRFEFAWIGAPDTAGERLEAHARGGSDRGYLDSVSLSLGGGGGVGDGGNGAGDGSGRGDGNDKGSKGDDGSGGDVAGEGSEGDGGEPASRTATREAVTVVSNVGEGLHEEPWRVEALSRDFQSAISVPLSYDEFTYGVLTVYAGRPSAFDDVARAVLVELGETVASAIAAVERKTALLTSSSTRLEFAVRDENFVFQRLAARADCTVSFDGGVRQHEDGTTVFATVDGASVDAVVAAANDLVAVRDAQVVTDDANGDASANGAHDGGTVVLQLSQPFLALQLADHGVVLRSVEATPACTQIVVDVPSNVDPRSSVQVVSNAFADVELRSKRTVERATEGGLRSKVLEELTDRQLEVVQLAYYGGYFEAPRERTGEEVAETLGISPAAFYRHNRTVQRKILSILFEDLGIPANAPPGVE